MDEVTVLSKVLGYHDILGISKSVAETIHLTLHFEIQYTK